jgi:integrase
LINDSLKKAERWSLISKNPAALVDRPKITKKEIKVWDLKQVKTFLKHAESSGRYYVAFMLALTTGARKGEILGLRFKDIDWKGNRIRITQTLSNDGKEINPYTKTKSGSRSIDLPEETIKFLKDHHQQIEKEKSQVDSGLYNDSDLVVCNEFGAHANSSYLRKIFNKIIKKAKLPQIRFHDMRHTHATILLLQGENPKIVSERLGHADVRITLDTYSHILPNMQKETAKKLGKLIYSESLDDEDENEM